VSNIGLFVQQDGTFDFEIENGDLRLDEGLETLCSVSVFSDRRATDEEVPLDDPKKQGWWGDLYSDIDQDKIGSKLWLLLRSKRTLETLRKAEDYVRESLQWLIEDGIASAITATASFEGAVTEGRWKIFITVTKPRGNESRFIVLWEKQKLIRG
jgi:phage gp46-like protein